MSRRTRTHLFACLFGLNALHEEGCASECRARPGYRSIVRLARRTTRHLFRFAWRTWYADGEYSAHDVARYELVRASPASPINSGPTLMTNSRGGLAVALARQLESVPWLRSSAAAVYHRARYLISRDRGPAARVGSNVVIADVLNRLPIEYRALPHFFGYYDKSPWASDNESLVLHVQESPTQLAICALLSGDSRVLGRTSTWSLQQGAMAQWLPGSDDVVWNERIGNELRARIVTRTGEPRRDLPLPVQAVCPTGAKYISLNYARLMVTRPEYGYPGKFANLAADMPLSEDGLWQVDMRTGDVTLLVNLDTLRNTHPRGEMEGAEHYVNHVMYSPSGKRFVFLHRWFGRAGLFSRLYVCGSSGTGLKLLRDERMVSHFTWKDERTLLVWARTPAPDSTDCYSLVDTDSGEGEALMPASLSAFGDGHPTYSPEGTRLLTDTYPDAARRRRLIIHRSGSENPTIVGDFFAPWKFNGPARCDLHPRWNRDGTKVAIDSAHDGIRRFYVLDVGAV